MTRKKLPAVLEPEEAQNLLKQPNKRYPTGLRNKAMLSLMLHCGLRVSEVVNLRPGNINLTKGKLRVENGKGNKDRDLAIPEYLIDLFDSWRKKRPESNFFFSTLLVVRKCARVFKSSFGNLPLEQDSDSPQSAL